MTKAMAWKQDPVFQRVLADALSIQDRFSAEPVYGRTGKGSLRSAGVDEAGLTPEELKLVEARLEAHKKGQMKALEWQAALRKIRSALKGME